MAKQAGHVRVGSIGSRVKTGHWSKRVIFKRVNRVTGQTGCGSNGSGQTGLTRFAMSTKTSHLATCIHKIHNTTLMGKNYDYCGIIFIWTTVNISFYTITTFHLNKYEIYCVIAPSFHSLFSFILPKGPKQRTIHHLLSTHLLFILSSQPQTYGTLLIIDSRIWACPVAIIFFSIEFALRHILFSLMVNCHCTIKSVRKLPSTCPQPDLSSIDKV